MRNLQVFSIFAIKGLLISLLFSPLAYPVTFKGYSKKTLRIRDTILTIYMATTPLQHKNGLSNIRRAELGKYSGMLFQGRENRVRQFWMYNTYFPLDIIFLDKSFKILRIEKNVPPSPPGSKKKIAEARPTLCHHVLEIPSDLKLSKFLTVGTKLNFY